ncbi:metal-dependent hydrolase, partial [Bordetella petrii]|nr:metal-dependent hydrolase [Bordetella petrii]
MLDNIAAALARAGVAIMTNAPGNRPFPPVLRLHQAGVAMFTGNDNIQDAWWPYGNGDMLQRAMLVGYRSGFYTDDALELALRMATHAGAAVLGRQGHELAPGNAATFVALRAPNAA